MRKLLLKTMLLLCALIVGSGTMWGQTETLVSGSGTSNYAVPTGWTTSGTVEGGSYLKLDNGTMTSPEFTPHTSLSFAYNVATFGSGTNHPLTIRILNASTNEIIVEETTETPTSSSYISTGSPISLGDIDVSFKIQLYAPTGKGVRLRNYSITGTPAASSYTITAQSNNNSYGTVSLSGSVITATPNSGYRVSSSTPYSVDPANSATVSQNGNEFTVTPSANTTVTINFEAIPTHTATFSVNGVTTTQNFAEGASITFPSDPASLYGKNFWGWTTATINGTTNTAPTKVNSATMGNSDITYYAVFALVTPGSSTTVTDVLTQSTTEVTGTGYAEFSKKTATSSAEYAGQCAGGNSSIQLRSNNNNSGVITTTSGGKAKKVAVEWESHTQNDRTLNIYGKNSAYTAATDLYDNSSAGTLLGTIVNGTSTELTITGDYEYLGLRSDDGAMYLTSISIDWQSGTPDTYSSYCTTVVAPTVVAPQITLGANPFTISTTATIACETEGATIKYSYDENTWNTYSSPLTITSTTTIYAKAEKDNASSDVVSVTATKNLATPTVTVSGNLTLDLDGGTNVGAGTLTADVTYNEAAVEGATVTWSGNNDAVATIDANGAVTLLTTGTVTFTATYTGNSDYASATGTKTVTVYDSEAPGGEDNPYSVADAITYINTLGESTSPNEVYVSGIISQIDSYSDQYNSITYWISDDGTTSTQMEVYSGKGLDGANFSSVNDLSVGDVVTVKGYVKMFNSTPEFTQNSKLFSHVHKTASGIAFSETSYDVAVGGTFSAPTASTVAGYDGTVSYASSNTEVATVDAATGAVTLRGVGTTTITATATETTNYRGGTASYTLNVKNVYTVTYYVAGVSNTTTRMDGATLSLDTPSPVAGMSFAGWSTTKNASSPSMVANTAAVTSDMTLYAMFAKQAGYYLVEANQTDWRGDYLIAYDAITFADGKVGGTGGMGAKGSSVSPSTYLAGNVVASEWGDQYYVTIEAKDDTDLSAGYLLKTQDGKYNYQSSNSNGLSATDNKETAADHPLTITFNSSRDIAISTHSTIFHYNPTGYFRFYNNGTQNAVYLYKKMASYSLGAIDVPVSAANYTSLYYSDRAFVVPAGVEARTYKVVNNNLMVSHTYEEDDVIPAATGVVLKADGNNTYTLVETNETGTADADNMLRGSDVAATTTGGTKYYKLSLDADNTPGTVGFYWGATDGGAFTNGAHKAYLAIPTASPIRGFRFDTATGISMDSIFEANNENAYDLQGRRISTPKNGLYIINGKKVLVK